MLGQFFSGYRVSKLLAHLAIDGNTKHVIDPMAGTGDLLDAVFEAALFHGITLHEIHGIEIHGDSAQICEKRLSSLCALTNTTCRVISGDAFKAMTYAHLGDQSYDLVIANPPYVRYQSLKTRSVTTRRDLVEVLSHRLEGPSRELWENLVSNYSGLADLSVPAWLLCALLVRPGGRLAIVTPAAWRSREYALVVRYLMVRAFDIECIVEDSPPGWFPDAQVGTHLIIARRLSDRAVAIPLSNRSTWPLSRWVNIEQKIASSTSLVGEVFQDSTPEAQFRNSCYRTGSYKDRGIRSRPFVVQNEWVEIQARLKATNWFRTLEMDHHLPRWSLPTDEPESTRWRLIENIPDRIRDLLPPDFIFDSLRPTTTLGIRVGQGLRTGCNRFFYVQLVEHISPELAKVKTSATFGSRVLTVPVEVLRPVLHRQTELDFDGCVKASTYVLDLRLWVLPEDLQYVDSANDIYRLNRQQKPRLMPHDLAQYVRDATKIPLDQPLSTYVPSLSTVRSYARPARHNKPPRFWYMLPDFQPRHQPLAFTPRVIHRVPRTYANTNSVLLVDANFSTIWSEHRRWSPKLLAIMFNSVWCRALMEAIGTRLGGGALKLEASHLRRLMLPSLDPTTVRDLLGLTESSNLSTQQNVDLLVLRSLLSTRKPTSYVLALAEALRSLECELRHFRQGKDAS